VGIDNAAAMNSKIDYEEIFKKYCYSSNPKMTLMIDQEFCPVLHGVDGVLSLTK